MGPTQPLTEMSIRNLPGIKGQLAHTHSILMSARLSMRTIEYAYELRDVNEKSLSIIISRLQGHKFNLFVTLNCIEIFHTDVIYGLQGYMCICWPNAIFIKSVNSSACFPGKLFILQDALY
jgi:hypothetical protein